VQGSNILDVVHATLGGLVGPLLLLSLVLAVLWTLLPFAVFGIKKRLDESLELQRYMLREMVRQREALGRPDEASEQ
jgi:hypothetical protein